MRPFSPLGSLVCFISACVPISLSAQIVLDGSLTPQQLVEEVLLGEGVTVSNITFNGVAGNIANEQIGAFYGANSVLTLDSGIVLATGPISIVSGPNNTGSMSTPLDNNTVFDQDLDEIAGALTMDGAVLEFDFVPQADSLTFKFSFASEEYLEWVDSQFNDAFGFFVSGPGINGPFSNNAVNLAVVPGTMDYVSVNTINTSVNPTYYQDNGDGFTSPYDSDPYYIQFDGFTRELEAGLVVECGQTYHMKMSIADASDPVWDSGVFIVGGTFSSTGSVSMAINTTMGTEELIEGCGGAVLTITRTNATGELILPLILEGDVSPEDIEGLPAEVVMADGEAQVQITFDAVNDDLAEMLEQLMISTSFEGACAGGGTATSIMISDPIGLSVIVPEVLLDCTGEPVDLVALVEGGFGAIDLLWSTGASDTTISVAGTPGSYIVTATDECGTVANAEALVDGPCAITIPNVFTPDNDGRNDRFIITGIEFTQNVVRIYNRWGQVVHEAQNYQNNWDGGDLSDGTYYYEVLVAGDDEPYTGHLTILHNE